MSKEAELSLMVAEFPMLPDQLLENMVTMANRIRESYMEGGLSAPMSTRVLRRWAYYYISLDRVSPEKRLPVSLMHVYALRLSAPEQDAVHALGEGIFTDRYYKV
ncbi:hypothetical protein D6779_02300 [Candidatus Parcubacteria bacterium]|nr:MAG: hypothetical protein D6779_02300 [Candidatus Parcubacteria bacterium]